MAQEALALYCVQYDAQAQACTQQAWMSPPSLLPPLSMEDVRVILPSIVMCFFVAWGWNLIVASIRN